MERHVVIWIVLMLWIILISGCTQVKDCGSDTECFLEAAKTCSPAKLTTSITSEKESLDTESRIVGLQGNECVFSLHVKGLTMSPEMPSDLAQDFNALKGSSMTCRIPKNVEIKTFDELKEQIMDVYNERCTGTYKTLSERLYEKIKGEMEKIYSEGIQQISTYCNINGNATIRIINVGTKEITSASTTITRTSPTAAGITTMSPSTIASGEEGIIYDESCGSGNICRYQIELPSGRFEEFVVMC